jgi:exonuclease III
VFLKKSTIGVPADLAHSGAAKKGASAAVPSLKKRKVSAPEQQELEETDDESACLHPSVASFSSTPVVSVLKVSYDFEDEKKGHHGEGRTITVEFDSFVLVACYVPNAGQKLERLAYRVREWYTLHVFLSPHRIRPHCRPVITIFREPHMRSYLKALSQRKPVVLAGDLNCAHGDLDVHNPRAKHISKMHGATPAERAAFTKLLEETEFRDALRFIHSGTANVIGAFSS